MAAVVRRLPFFVVGRPLGCSHAYDCIRLVFEILNCDLLVRTLRRIMTVNNTDIQ